MKKININSIEDLYLLLLSYGIPVEEYGHGDKKDLEDFFSEIHSGESELYENTDGSLLRVIHTVNIFILFKTDTIYEFLREEKQIFSDEREKVRNLIPSLSEKVKKFNNTRGDLCRAFREELNLELNLDLIEFLDDREETKMSRSYGIMTKNCMRDFYYPMPEKDYRLLYKEVQAKKTCYWSWQEVIM